MNDPRFRGIGMTSARTRDRLVARLVDQGIADPRILERVRELPRHAFVDEALASRAYEDTALPIGHGQTISQPYVVARMTEALLKGGELKKVLEVGTGCGYQTAVLAPFVRWVYTVERIEPLVHRATSILRDLSIRNVRTHHGDGFAGWERFAPFDGILVTAAPPAVPQALLDQLADGGRLIIPVGPTAQQVLTRIRRVGDKFERDSLGDVRFVPLLTGMR
ncbi:MAG: protein-L-isoaspartate(D-aspartate) O-methyltransferase [Gammaproteobacteria bacterium]